MSKGQRRLLGSLQWHSSAHRWISLVAGMNADQVGCSLSVLLQIVDGKKQGLASSIRLDQSDAAVGSLESSGSIWWNQQGIAEIFGKSSIMLSLLN
jgi:hypothetical protein